MDRPKNTIVMDFQPDEWLSGKADVKTRPAVFKMAVQMPLDPQGEVPFTAWYEADGRMYRVDGIAARGADVAAAMAIALEYHWWRMKPVAGIDSPLLVLDGR